MSLFDSASALLSKTTSDVTKASRSVSLQAQLKDLERQRQAAMSRLGEAFYAELSSNESLRSQHEALFSCIEDLTFQINKVRYDLQSLESAARIADLDQSVCLKCGAPIPQESQFCSACGAKVPRQDTPILHDGQTCPKCHAPVEPDQAFCTACGSKIN